MLLFFPNYPDFLKHIVKENQAIIVYQPMANGGDINKIRFRVPEDQKDNF